MQFAVYKCIPFEKQLYFFFTPIDLSHYFVHKSINPLCHKFLY